MTRSRKLLVAAALLAGGYGLALLVSGLSDFLWARRLIGGASATASWGDAPLNGSLINGPTAIDNARLVPESTNSRRKGDTAQRASAPAANAAAARPATTPAWVTPVLQASWVGAANDTHHDSAAAAQTASNADASAGQPAVAAETETTDGQPRARLTDVKRSGHSATGATTAAQAASASPWDRWPRWDPPVEAAAQTKPKAGELAGVAAETVSIGPLSAPDAHPKTIDGPADDVIDDIAELRTHVVIDGDSLTRLADRYLDDPASGDAIFQLNLDVLSDPELLPIGVELKIPPRQMASSLRAGQPNRRDTFRSEVHPADALPVDDAGWQSVHGAPQAQLLRLQPPSAAPATNGPATPSW